MAFTASMFNFDKESWQERSQYCSEEKEAAAKVCSGLVLNQVDGQLLATDQYPSIFLDGGTTFVEVFKAIVFHIADSPVRHIRLYTTNAEVLRLYLGANEARHVNVRESADQIDLNIIGGKFLAHHRALDGSLFDRSVLSDTYDQLFDKAFIGVSAIDEELNLRIAPRDSVKFRKTAIECAQEVIIVCDDSKFNKIKQEGSHEFGHLLHSQGRLEVASEKDRKRPVRASVIVGVSKNYEKRIPFMNFLKTMKDAGLSVSDPTRSGVIRIEWR
jgi:DeoR/GlpR family transcriptional regulator of sugar metabolism